MREVGQYEFDDESVINQFGLHAGEAACVVNMLAAGSKYGAAEVVDLAQSFKVIRAHIEDMKISLFNATGGLAGYISALGETAVMFSQLLPLGELLKNITAGTTALSISIGSRQQYRIG